MSIKMIEIGFEIQDEQDMSRLAQLIANAFEQSTMLYLHGHLGSGKTTLARYIIQALGCKDHIKSPTYTLVECYQLKSWRICHLDLYRLVDAQELEFIGIRDYLDDETIYLIEWPENAGGYLTPADIDIYIDFHVENKRRMKLVSNSIVGDKILTKIKY